MQRTWAPTELCYLDSSTYGIPPRTASAELIRVVQEWSVGSYNPLECDAAIARARAAFARMHGVAETQIAIGHQVAPMVAAFVAATDRAGKVVTAAGDFTSLLFPFAAAGREVVNVPLERLPEAIGADTAIVAVSSVQSCDGRLADLEAIAAAAAHHGSYTLIDTTQSSGWLPLDAARFDAVVAGGYKWLCNPRGTAFMSVSPRLVEAVPVTANWFAADQPWETCYGMPLRLAPDARRFDVSPAWLNWHAAAVALEALEATGVEHIHAHNVALAARIREAFGLEPLPSAIVSLELPDGAGTRLRASGIKTSERAGRLRISCHTYNDDHDIDRLLEALRMTPALAA